MRRRKSQEAPRWPSDGKGPRVLVEDEDGASQQALEHLLSRAGYQVAVCPGPARLPDRSCPLVETGHCALASGADVVLNDLHLGDRTNEAVLQALQDAYPATPIVVEIPQPDVARHEALLRGCQVMFMPATAAQILRSVGDALGPGAGIS
jgi:DNA-binding NtrC family response regulator